MSRTTQEIIAVRSLTESDLGLFSVHRSKIRAKQRAININADIAKALLTPKAYNQGGASFDCVCSFRSYTTQQRRTLRKTHKNWRLGGPKIDGALFSALDSKDFLLLRSVSPNDGTQPLVLTFVSRKTDRVVHAGIAAIVAPRLSASMTVFRSEDPSFRDLAVHCSPFSAQPVTTQARRTRPNVPPMPRDQSLPTVRDRSVADKLMSPHILERMLRVAADLSAPAQAQFLRTVGALAEQLRVVLLRTNHIVRVHRDQRTFWRSLSGRRIGFVDGGLANLSALGSAPIAARVGGYSVVPGRHGADREDFVILKHLIDELYSGTDGGVYDDSFPDVGALRDAARISIEAAGVLQLLKRHDDLDTVLLHGALVNPVSRYSDVMRDGTTRHRFPDFTDPALSSLLPAEAASQQGRSSNFISVYLRQLQLLGAARPIVCGVVERESASTSVCRKLLDQLPDAELRDLLPEPPDLWKQHFRELIDPALDEDVEGPRITDALLFRCVLEPGEALRPVAVDRNDSRRAPPAWHSTITRYPTPFVSYLQVTDWAAPIRLELFRERLDAFGATARLVMHCALLLPRYAFPVGLDIVDRFARIPNWLARPVNTATAVRAMKIALEQRDTALFRQLRTLLCGSGREFLLRPGLTR